MRNSSGAHRSGLQNLAAGSRLLLVGALAAAVAACGTAPTLGGSGTVATGSAGGETSSGASPQLEKCSEPLGTLAVDEDTNSEWYRYLRNYRLGSTTPVLRMSCGVV